MHTETHRTNIQKRTEKTTKLYAKQRTKKKIYGFREFVIRQLDSHIFCVSLLLASTKKILYDEIDGSETGEMLTEKELFSSATERNIVKIRFEERIISF